LRPVEDVVVAQAVSAAMIAADNIQCFIRRPSSECRVWRVAS
jgi:hypothetical protein